MHHYISVLLLLFVALPRTALSEEVVVKGRLTDVAEQIGKLVHLTWTENRLTVDRQHWTQFVENDSSTNEEQEELDRLLQRGIPVDIARRMVAKNVRQRLAGRNNRGHDSDGLPESQLFALLRQAAGASSHGRSAGSSGMSWRCHGEDFAATMQESSDRIDFRLALREIGGASQEFLIEDHRARGLTIQFVGPTRRLIFSQSPSGMVRVASISDHRNDAFCSQSYDEMAVSQQAFANDLGDLLERVGINRPFSNFDPRIVEGVARTFEMPDATVLEAANRAIASLGASEHEEREAAQSLVDRSATNWRHIIQKKLADPTLDPEIRSRLNRVAQASGIGRSAEEVFIRQRNLLQDPDYLSAILEKAPDSVRPHIQEHLDALRANR